MDQMPAIKQNLITREDLQANPNVFYVFGDNAARTGYGGQAAEMRGEPNAIGIRTKWFPNMDQNSFFSDHASYAVLLLLREDIEEIESKLRAGAIVVFPRNGIGTGFAQMERRAPKCFAYLKSELERLQNDYQ
jgi:hypothetical protein